MPDVLLWLLATVAGLLALAFWWIRRNNMAVYPEGKGPLVRDPVPLHCEVGATLMMAAATDTADAGSPAPSEPRRRPLPDTGTTTPKRKERSGPPRRAFLRNFFLITVGGVTAAWGGASIGFLWPNLTGGFGARISVGTPDSVRQAIAEGGGRYEYPAGRMYVVAYDAALDPDGQYEEITGGSPFMALYQKCVHLGCRVPWCASSHWFECPCHGSRYNNWGEYQFGPAPRGLDRFAVELDGDEVFVNTATVITGPARSASVLSQPPQGPHCN